MRCCCRPPITLCPRSYCSLHTRERPNLCRLLVRFANEHIACARRETKKSAKDADEFFFTSIQVNKNYASALHVDRNYCGPSLIIGLGNFEGGQLWTFDQGPLDVKNKWVSFDGNLPHGTLCFSGNRYSLIFFTVKHHESILPFHRQRLVELGFSLPPVRKDSEAAQQASPPFRVLSRGHAAFQSWLRLANAQKLNGDNGSAPLTCGVHCAAHMQMAQQDEGISETDSNSNFDSDSDARNQELESSRGQEASGTGCVRARWLRRLKPGSRVDARYLGGSTFFPGNIAAVHTPGVFDVRFDDGDYELAVPEDRLRLPSEGGFPAASRECSDEDLSRQVKSETALAVAEATMAASIAPSAFTAELKRKRLAPPKERLKVEAYRCCPLLQLTDVTTEVAVDDDEGSIESNSTCHKANVDLDLRRMASRFPLRTKLWDNAIEGPAACRVVVAYHLSVQVSPPCWMVRTSSFVPSSGSALAAFSHAFPNSQVKGEACEALCFVGQSVRKEFEGHGIFNGIVRSARQDEALPGEKGGYARPSIESNTKTVTKKI